MNSPIEWTNARVPLTCKNCGTTFTSRKICKSRQPKFCTMKCYAESLTGKSATENQIKGLAVMWIGIKNKTRPHPALGKHWNLSVEQRERISVAKSGEPLSDSHRAALSKAKLGKSILHLIKNKDAVAKKISDALIGKAQPWNRGENHPNWQGGITPLNFKIRNSLEMKEWRRQVFKRDDFTCRLCKKRGGKLHADHIVPFAIAPLLRFDLKNGRTLCVSCHRQTDTWGGRAVKNKLPLVVAA